jgi:DNA-binding Lrp family transcriptional regulator
MPNYTADKSLKNGTNPPRRNGFTMVSDYLVWKYNDHTLALVYGKIERFCKLGVNNRCEASIETFEKELGIWNNTIIKRIKFLEKEGYVVDRDPGLKNKTHARTITGKLAAEEESFQEWAEEYRQTQLAGGAKLSSYYDCFLLYYSGVENMQIAQSVSKNCIVSQSELHSDYAATTNDKTLNTSNTPDTFGENIFENCGSCMEE